ncbi:unnamed protein product [Psylliodes chrysocephalus]|uniref:Zinc finger PHD-type domain-containing protein n=1 Tax=Psylliodes chrysocephalus TaxID=3402493 RepID=A0A9P0CLR4_9CUCU|nr:unnamed protein product [Psylliodes chrysocephala]
MSTVNCTNCTKILSDQDTTNIQCDGCKWPIHLACTGLSAEDRVMRNSEKCLKIFCSVCNASLDIKTLLASFKNDLSKKQEEMKIKFCQINQKLSNFEHSTTPQFAQEAIIECTDLRML